MANGTVFGLIQSLTGGGRAESRPGEEERVHQEFMAQQRRTFQREERELGEAERARAAEKTRKFESTQKSREGALGALEGILGSMEPDNPARAQVEASYNKLRGGMQLGQHMVPEKPEPTGEMQEAGLKARLRGLQEAGKASRHQELLLEEMTSPPPKIRGTPQTMVAFNKETGERKRAVFDPDIQKTTDEQGNVLGPEWLSIKTELRPATAGAITQTQQGKAEVEAREGKIRTEQALRVGDRMSELLTKNRAAFTTGARLTAFADTLWTAARSIPMMLGMETNLSHSNPLDYPNEFWGELANASDEAKLLSFTLALQLAASMGLGSGRDLSDKNIQQALRLVGEDIQNPDRMIRRIKQNQRTLIENSNIRRREIFGPGSEVFQDRLKKLGGATDFGAMGAEEFVKLFQTKMLDMLNGVGSER